MRRRGAPGPAPWGGRRRPPSSGRAAATGRVRRLRHPGGQAVEDLVDGPFPDGQLVHGELGVRGHLVLGRGPLAGLEVDDVRPPLGVPLDPVHGATDAYGVLARFEGDVEVVLAGRGGAPGAVHDVPAQEAFQGGPGVVLLLLRLPGGVEHEAVPHGVQSFHQDVQVGGGAAGGHLVGEHVDHVAEALGGRRGGVRLHLTAQEPLEGTGVGELVERAPREGDGAVPVAQRDLGAGRFVQPPPAVRVGHAARAAGPRRR